MSSRDPGGPLPLPGALGTLRALAEETRLRIVALLAAGELSVSDLTDILAQSQPRISRHLKLLVEAGLIVRHREGAWAFFRLSDAAEAQALLVPVLASLAADDPRLAGDRERLVAVRQQRSASAQAYFAGIASRWDGLRSLQVSEDAIEAAILDVVGEAPIGALLDLGTGTGRMLQLLAGRADRAVGLDANHAMLSVARANLERDGLGRAELRQGDIHAPPFPRGTFDLVVVHQVLHYLDDPGRALLGAGRLLAPGGRLLVVDFAPHVHEELRTREAHRRLGFTGEQMAAWFAEAGLARPAARTLAPPRAEGGLTVMLWCARLKGAGRAPAAPTPEREVA